MKITRVINNNIVVTRDDGLETILAGSGIGFQKKIGDEADITKVEKQYHLLDNQLLSYESLFKNTPILYFSLAEDILQLATKKFQFKINNATIFALADHIYCAVCRTLDGIAAPNLILQEIQILYKDEYELGEQAIQRIAHKTNVTLSSDEAGYIALHIVNARTDGTNESAEETIMLTEGIMEILTEMYDFHPDPKQFYYQRFLIHLKFLSHRILCKQELNISDLSSMYEDLMEKYNAYKPCLLKINAFIEDEFQYTLNQEESLYLLIHMIKILHA